MTSNEQQFAAGTLRFFVLQGQKPRKQGEKIENPKKKKLRIQHHEDESIKTYQKPLLSKSHLGTNQTEPERNDPNIDWLDVLFNTSLEKSTSLGYNSGVFRPNSLVDFYRTGSHPKYTATNYNTIEVPESFKPPIIIGLPRCGTTMVTACLGRHPNLLPINELHSLLSAIFPQSDIFSSQSPQNAKILQKTDINPQSSQKMRQILYKTQSILQSKLTKHATLVIKEVNLSLYRAISDSVFNGSKCFELTRRPQEAIRSASNYRLKWDLDRSGYLGYDNTALNTALEYLKGDGGMGDVMLPGSGEEIEGDDLEIGCVWYVACSRAMVKWVEENGGEGYLKMAYEDFLEKPRRAFGVLLEFLGLDASEQFLDEVEQLATHPGGELLDRTGSKIFSDDILWELYETNLTRV